MVLDPTIHVRLRWLKKAEGGRSLPPQGSSFRATAQFSSDPDLYSVFVRFKKSPEDDPRRTEAEMHFVSFHLVSDMVFSGKAFHITAGPTPVAEAEVLRVEFEKP
jgi:hypothetical protein